MKFTTSLWKEGPEAQLWKVPSTRVGPIRRPHTRQRPAQFVSRGRGRDRELDDDWHSVKRMKRQDKRRGVTTRGREDCALHDVADWPEELGHVPRERLAAVQEALRLRRHFDHLAVRGGPDP